MSKLDPIDKPRDVQDTREKLEADILDHSSAILDHDEEPSGYELINTDLITVREWLDRQASIAVRDYLDGRNLVTGELYFASQERIAELERENEKLRELVHDWRWTNDRELQIRRVRSI